MSTKTKVESTDVNDEQLREWYEHYKSQQKKWGERYRTRQRLLKAKLTASGIEVSEEEVDEAMNK